jgi:hypothetical protein
VIICKIALQELTGPLISSGVMSSNLDVPSETTGVAYRLILAQGPAGIHDNGGCIRSAYSTNFEEFMHLLPASGFVIDHG